MMGEPVNFDDRAALNAPTAPRSTPPRRRAPFWVVPVVCAVVTLAGVAAVGARLTLATPQSAGGQTPTATPATSPLALDPATYGLACVAGAAWSPDSASIAILGTRHGCAESTPGAYYPAVVAIVNAKNGHILTSLQPDATVLTRFDLHVPQDGAPIIGPDDPGANGDLIQPGVIYDSPIWSPDSASIAVPFSFAYMATPPAGGSSPAQRVSVSGVYVGADAGAASGSGGSAFGVTLSQQIPYVAEWNVKTGQPVVAPGSPDSGLYGGTVAQLEPASLSYSWRPDGSLAGSGALTTSQPPAPAPPGLVGNPDGGTSFTVWQGMHVQADAGDPQSPQAAAAFMADAHFLAWSPDGTYLLSASYDWRIQPGKQAVPTAIELQREGVANRPLLPIRDAAMDAMLSPAAGTHPYTFASDAFAWSPDGKLLAAIADGGANTISADVTVLIASCATGKTLATLQVGSSSTAFGNIASLQWSPDGKRLLIGAESEYFVVGPGELPQE